jgi:hypothetical protein
MDSYTSSQPHPYGVLPSGNAYLIDSNDNEDILFRRYYGLGRLLNKLSDENIIEILSYLNINDLTCVISSSKDFYVYAHYGNK